MNELRLSLTNKLKYYIDLFYIMAINRKTNATNKKLGNKTAMGGANKKSVAPKNSTRRLITTTRSQQPNKNPSPTTSRSNNKNTSTPSRSNTKNTSPSRPNSRNTSPSQSNNKKSPTRSRSKSRAISKPSKLPAEVCYSAKQGPRESMEDTYQIMHFRINGKLGTFYGVFDGHGGKDVSYELCNTKKGLFPFLIEAMKKHGDKNLPKLLQEKYLEYDKNLYKQNKTAGSTAIVVLHYNRHLYMINLGDSRGLMYTRKMKNQIVSQDHKPQKPVEKRRIYKAGHYVTPFRTGAKKQQMVGDIKMVGDKPHIYLHGNWEPISMEQYNRIMRINNDVDVNRVSNSLALSRAFGDFYLKTDQKKRYLGPRAAISPIPDIQVLDLDKHKGQDVYFLLASDGFWDVNNNTKKLRTDIMNHPNMQKLCEELVDASLQPPKSSTDNTTIILAKIKN